VSRRPGPSAAKLPKTSVCTTSPINPILKGPKARVNLFETLEKIVLDVWNYQLLTSQRLCYLWCRFFSHLVFEGISRLAFVEQTTYVQPFNPSPCTIARVQHVDRQFKFAARRLQPCDR
jgi:hypothetical protein